MNAKERFLKYISFDTGSDSENEGIPSTEKQWNLARYLRDEMTAMGLSDVNLSENCYVTGYLPANTEGLPTIGFIAHMDTYGPVPGGPVNVREIYYEGGEILLNEKENLRFTPSEKVIGHHILITDGTTLLGGDDKAGIAEILTAVEYFLENPEVKHGRVAIGFTPDEEIGRGPAKFDVAGFGADFAYTLDGSSPDVIDAENFNAAAAKLTVKGLSCHTGSAKGKMKNALRMAMEFVGELPSDKTPETTEGYEGFIHLDTMSGDVSEARVSFLLRDHDSDKLEAQKELLQSISKKLEEKYGEGRFQLEFKDGYRNMKEMVMTRPEVLTIAENAVKEAGLNPRYVPIRGGTDGAKLSFMGLICPNLGTGSRFCHGVLEHVSLEDMNMMVEIVKNIIKTE